MIKQGLFTDWHFMRWVRLGLSIFIAVQALQTQHIFFGFIATFFLYQTVTNTGCGAAGCSAPLRRDNKGEEEVIFEEVK